MQAGPQPGSSPLCLLSTAGLSGAALLTSGLVALCGGVSYARWHV